MSVTAKDLSPLSAGIARQMLNSIAIFSAEAYGDAALLPQENLQSFDDAFAVAATRTVSEHWAKIEERQKQEGWSL